jgi:hypothetical protein
MDSPSSSREVVTAPRRQTTEVSYKFQRLRERLRQAVLTGQLKGKLPGERALAKAYNCNAKTLSKALTDLAAEGLLDRSIGRGTYVKGSAPAEEELKPWLVLGSGAPSDHEIVRLLAAHNPRCQLVVGVPSNRPSFLNQFSAIIDLSGTCPDTLLRDLVVRAVPLVAIDTEPRTFSLDSVIADLTHGAARIAREAVQLGHTRIGTIELPSHSSFTTSVRSAVGARGTVDSFSISDAVRAADDGVTVLICSSISSAANVLAHLAAAGIPVPGRVSVAAVGLAGASVPCTGAYVNLEAAISQAAALLADRQPRRPATLWLAPRFADHGTLASPALRSSAELGIATAAMLAQ